MQNGVTDGRTDTRTQSFIVKDFIIVTMQIKHNLCPGLSAPPGRRSRRASHSGELAGAWLGVPSTRQRGDSLPGETRENQKEGETVSGTDRL